MRMWPQAFLLWKGYVALDISKDKKKKKKQWSANIHIENRK